MKARSLRLAGKPIDIYDPMSLAAGAAADGDVEALPSGKASGEANGATHPEAAKPRRAKSRREQQVNGHAANAENGARGAAELPGLRAELARARAQIASLEASEKRLGRQLSRITDSQNAQARSLEHSLAALGDELGNVLAERSAAELRAEAATETLARLTVEHERTQTEATELRNLLDRLESEWREERAALAAERDTLAVALTGANERAAELGAQAAWADGQIAKLVEGEAETAGQLLQREQEIESLSVRVEALLRERDSALAAQQDALAASRERDSARAAQQDALAAAEAERRRGEGLRSEFRSRARRLVGIELAAADPFEILDAVRLRLRELERALDRCDAECERHAATMQPRRPAVYARLVRGLRRIPGILRTLATQGIVFR